MLVLEGPLFGLSLSLSLDFEGYDTYRPEVGWPRNLDQLVRRHVGGRPGKGLISHLRDRIAGGHLKKTP